MGAAATRVDWGKTPLPGYDLWGYNPPGLIPSQNQWSELMTVGFPPGTPQGSGLPYNQAYVAGQANDVLEVFGQNPSTKTDTLLISGVPQIQQFANIHNEGTFWPPIAGDSTVCDPSTYPNCNLATFRANAPTINPYAQWWSGVDLTPSGGSSIVHSPAGPAIDAMDNWLTKVDATYKNYAVGGLEALKEVNPEDTSDYDPCDQPSILEFLFPVATGVALSLSIDVVGFEFVGALSQEGKLVLQITLFGIGFYGAKAALQRGKLFWGNNEEAREDADKAANFATIGGGFVIASTIAYYSDLSNSQQLLAGGVGSLITYKIMQYKVSQILYLASFSTGILGLLLNGFEGISYFLCRLQNWAASACDDGEKHPHARRWDVASLAARLTDLACEQEGWQRDSAQAEFVYRGLVTNPNFMNAAKLPADKSIYQQTTVNPIGQVVPVQASVIYNPFAKDKYDGWSETGWSFTGTEQAGWTATDQNRFACQNFEVLLDGGEGPNAARSKDSTGRDRTLATNFHNWLQKLIEKARDPYMITKQALIPGLTSRNYSTPYLRYSCGEYLSTCGSDYDESTGRGFNSVQERGNYAGLYKVDDCEGPSVEWTMIEANMFLQQPSLGLAWSAASNIWNNRNLIALAHYWDSEIKSINVEKSLQRDSFILWWGDGDPRVNSALKEFNFGFTAEPTLQETNLPGYIKPLPTPTDQLQPPLLKPLQAPGLIDQTEPAKYHQCSADIEQLFDFADTKGLVYAGTSAYGALNSGNISLDSCLLGDYVAAQIVVAVGLTTLNYNPHATADEAWDQCYTFADGFGQRYEKDQGKYTIVLQSTATTFARLLANGVGWLNSKSLNARNRQQYFAFLQGRLN
jgi:hypothetical protein